MYGVCGLKVVNFIGPCFDGCGNNADASFRTRNLRITCSSSAGRGSRDNKRPQLVIERTCTVLAPLRVICQWFASGAAASRAGKESFTLVI